MVVGVVETRIGLPSAWEGRSGLDAGLGGGV